MTIQDSNKYNELFKNITDVLLDTLDSGFSDDEFFDDIQINWRIYYDKMLRSFVVNFNNYLSDEFYLKVFEDTIKDLFIDYGVDDFNKESDEILKDLLFTIEDSDNWLSIYQDDELRKEQEKVEFEEWLRNNGTTSIRYEDGMYIETYTPNSFNVSVNIENFGYIYVMSNPSMHGIIKIGLTKRSPEERLDELSKATGVPTPFILVYKEKFNDCVKAEKIIHSILEERGERVASNREFFNTDISEAIKIIQKVKKSDETEIVMESNDFKITTKSISKEYLEKGLNYMNGYGDFLQDYDNAIKYLEKAGDLGEAEAYYRLGNLFIDTSKEDDLALDVKHAIKYFEKGRLLEGKYSIYCNAGLALCFANKNLTHARIRNYIPNDANALKCWIWFFEKLDFNESDFLARHYILDSMDHFLLNEGCSIVYKQKLEPVALIAMQKCLYSLYDMVRDSLIWKHVYSYLICKFEKYQLHREVVIKWIPKENNYNEDGIFFNVEIQKGTLMEEDILSFDGYGGAYRIIQNLSIEGNNVQKFSEGEKGTIKVLSILDDFGGYIHSNLRIKVIGSQSENNTIIDNSKTNDNETIDNKIEGKGFLGNLKKWFSKN